LNVPASTTKPERRRDLDQMRMFVVIGLVFFHTARVFDTYDWYVKNDPTSELVTIALSFAAMWGMPLLFVIAGMGMSYSLRARTTKAFAWERIRRLLVPLVFGMAVIVPPQIWTRLRGDPGYDEAYWQFLTRFFDTTFDMTNFPLIIKADPATNLFEPAHLWFVVLLFAFSLLLVPVIWALRRPAGSRLVNRLADGVDRFWLIVMAGLPLGILDAAFGSEIEFAGWNRYSYAVFLLYGYFLAADRRFGSALVRYRRRALLLAVVSFAVVGALFAFGSETEGADLLLDRDLLSVAMRTVRGVSGWLWVVAIMGFVGGSGKQKGSMSRQERESTLLDRASAYASEAVLPFYVLHQTVIVLLAVYVVDWPMNLALKYLTICVISFVVIVAIYDVAVRRTRVTRFLFGMKPPVR
jgi:peptidoglycan/LPS O-acetylase OafA/YrhL